MLFLIKTLYPHKNGFEDKDKEELKAIATAWQMVLEDLDFGLVQKCLHIHSATNQFAPSISEIRKIATEIKNPSSQTTADMAWEKVLYAVRKYGYGRKEEAIASLPEEVREMGARWFDEIGQTENDNLGVIRGQFISAWKTNAERKKFMDQLPEGSRNLLKGVKMLVELSDGTN